VPDLRPVLYVNGLFLLMLGVAMQVPVLVDANYHNPDWQVFLAASLASIFAGGGLVLSTRGYDTRLEMRQAFLLTVSTWLVLPAFGALPFVFSELDLGYTEAFFEAMSGLTTTGATVIVGLDHAPPGILIWRSLLQWLGGIGIIVMAVAVMPMLQVGGMQLFRLESSDTSDKIVPRVTEYIGALAALYVGLTALCAVALGLAGLSAFDAVAHAMTTIATGGFSTSDASVGMFGSASVDIIVTLFMIVGSLPFVLYIQAARGRPLLLWRDDQVRLFLLLVVVLVVMLATWLWMTRDFTLPSALRFTAFNVVSVMTGTGYATADYNAWGSFAVAVFFVIMFIGGCAGSTSCGIKIFRFHVLVALTRAQIRRLFQPHGVFVPRYNGRPLPESVGGSVMSFLFLFLVIFLLLTLVLVATGLDFVTAISGAGSALANVGPGLGDIIGPAGNYQSLPATAKWFLALGMLLGRLELFTVLVLLTPGFWRA